MAQVSDEGFFATLDPEANSIAVLVKHIAGNLRSRWTDFLTTDGEKPDRLGDGGDARFRQHGAGWDAGATERAGLQPRHLQPEACRPL